MITKAHLKVIQNFHQELWVFCAKVNGKIDLQAGDVIGNAKRINAYRAETRNFRAALQNKRARARGVAVQFFISLCNLPRGVLTLIGAELNVYDRQSRDLLNTIEKVIDERDMHAQISEVANI